jgi:methyltransferase (TIGR00027 family)
LVTVADTAFSIAVVRAEERDRPEGERLFTDQYAKLFAAAGAHAAEATQRFLDLPCFREGIRLRTRFIDDAVRDALYAGARQLVILGAGFDMRGLRLPEVERNGVVTFEIDAPEQMDRKQAVLRDAGVTLPESIRHVPFNFDEPEFEQRLAATLKGVGFKADLPTMFVWEGVIGYIDAETIACSLHLMATVGGSGSRLVFTYGFNSFEPDGPEVHVRRAGFTSFAGLGLDDVWRRY